MLGLATATQSSLSGGQRFNSFNPDAVLTYITKNNLEIFGEIFGQTHTGPHQGSGYNFDGGIAYLLSENMTIDAEVAQRISGNLSGFNQYIGAGLGILF